MPEIASLLLLAAMSALGVAVLWRTAPHLAVLERLAYGAPIGMVLGTLALVPLGMAGAFGGPGVVGVGLACAGLAAVLARPSLRSRGAPRLSLREPLRAMVSLPLLVLGAFGLRWAIYWRTAIGYRGGDLWAGHVAVWGDWPVHIGLVSSFAYGANFPPQHPRFADHPLAYHYLADLTAAGQVALGMEPAAALALHSLVGCILVAVGVYAFARRLLRARGAATLAVVLFLLGGGLGWLVTVENVVRSGDLLGTLSDRAWDRMINSDRTDGPSNFQVVNVFYGFLSSQRAFLYGLPIAFASLSTILVATRRGRPAGRRWRLFALAGVIAGLLPLAHLATLLAFVLLIPALFLVFPSRFWLAFGVAAVTVALPQLLSQLGGGVGALASLRLEPGWEAAPEPWPLFWAKNLGLAIPLAALALLRRGVVPERSRRFLAAFLVIFAAINIVAFQPWRWDNHKLLVYWLLAGSILSAAGLAWLWRRQREVLGRVTLAVALATMIGSGLLEDLGQALGQSSYRMLRAPEIRFATLVRERTPLDSVFVTGMLNHDPLAMFSGRQLFVGYPNWLWTEGLPYGPRQAIVEAIYADPAVRDGLLAANRIEFVVVGPHERDSLGADEVSFRAAYPVVVEADGWLLFDVRGLADGLPHDPAPGDLP